MKHLVIAFLFILAIATTNMPTRSSGAFNTVAIAGRTVTGGWCECGCPACICDPGEQPTLCGGHRLRTDRKQLGTEPATENNPGMETGAAFLAVITLLFAVLRLTRV